jgi:hypothetical protein
MVPKHERNTRTGTGDAVEPAWLQAYPQSALRIHIQSRYLITRDRVWLSIIVDEGLNDLRMRIPSIDSGLQGGNPIPTVTRIDNIRHGMAGEPFIVFPGKAGISSPTLRSADPTAVETDPDRSTVIGMDPRNAEFARSPMN